jgi:hypothetical protein
LGSSATISFTRCCSSSAYFSAVFWVPPRLTLAVTRWPSPEIAVEPGGDVGSNGSATASTSLNPSSVGRASAAAILSNACAYGHCPVVQAGSFAEIAVDRRTSESVSSDWWKSFSTICFTRSDCEPGTSNPPWDSRSASFWRNGIAANSTSSQTTSTGHRRRNEKAPSR